MALVNTYLHLGGPWNPRSIITTSCNLFALHVTRTTWWCRNTLNILSNVMLCFGHIFHTHNALRLSFNSPEFWLGVHGISQHISSVGWIMELKEYNHTSCNFLALHITWQLDGVGTPLIWWVKLCWLSCIENFSWLASFGACLELVWSFEQRTYYINSLGAKSNLASLGMLKWTNQNCSIVSWWFNSITLIVKDDIDDEWWW